MKKIAIIALALLLVACGKKEESSQKQPTPGTAITPAVTSTPAQADMIMPLKPGNLWVYQVTALDTANNRMVLLKVDTFEVAGDTVVDSELWHKFNALGSDSGRAINRNDGLWFSPNNDAPYLFAKYPAAIGEEYSTTIFGIPTANKVLSHAIDVEVPAGKFSCYAYAQYVGPQKILTIYYFTPGKGLIKMEVPDSTKSRVFASVDLLKLELK